MNLYLNSSIYLFANLSINNNKLLHTGTCIVPYLVILAGDTNTSTVFECKIYTVSLAIVNIQVAYDVRGHASGAL